MEWEAKRHTCCEITLGDKNWYSYCCQSFPYLREDIRPIDLQINSQTVHRNHFKALKQKKSVFLKPSKNNTYFIYTTFNIENFYTQCFKHLRANNYYFPTKCSPSGFFFTETECISCAVRTGSYTQFGVIFFFKGLRQRIR